MGLRRKVAGWLVGPELEASRQELASSKLELAETKLELAKHEAKFTKLVDTLPVYRFGFPITKEWTAQRAVAEGLKVNPWVYACAMAYAEALIPVPHKVQQLVGQEWVDVPGHPAAERFGKPNAFMSRSDLIMANLFELFTGGNFITSVVDSTTSKEARTLELWPISQDQVSPIPDAVDFIASYKIGRYMPVLMTYDNAPPGTVRQDERFESPRNIVHCKFWDPANPWWGLSPLQAAARVIDTDVAAIRWNFSMLENRAIAGGVFTTPQQLDTDQHRKLKKLLKDEVSGADNVYNNLLLTHGTTFQESGKSPVEMDFTNSRKLSREEICAVLRTPPPIVGISENATLANLQQYKRAFYEDSVIPLSVIVMDAYNRAWVQPRWGPNVRLVFEFARVPAMSSYRTERVQDYYRLWLMGWPADVLNRYLDMGLPEGVPLLDRSMVAANVLPLERALEGETTSQPVGATAEGKDLGFARVWAALAQLRDELGREVP